MDLVLGVACLGVFAFEMFVIIVVNFLMSRTCVIKVSQGWKRWCAGVKGKTNNAVGGK